MPMLNISPMSGAAITVVNGDTDGMYLTRERARHLLDALADLRPQILELGNVRHLLQHEEHVAAALLEALVELEGHGYEDGIMTMTSDNEGSLRCS